MVVYIDSLFMINLFMDSALMLITGMSLKNQFRIFRILWGATYLSVYGTVIFFAELNYILSYVLNIIFLIPGVIISFGIKNVFRGTIVYLITAAICGGIIFSLSLSTNLGTIMNTTIANGIIYMNINPFVLIAGCVLLYFSAEFYKRLYIRNFSREKIIEDVYFLIDNNEYKARCLIDTGCNLTEPIRGTPMVIVGKGVLPVCGTSEIYVNTVGGVSSMRIIFPDRVWIKNNHISINPKTPVAVADYKISSDDIYEGIINPDAITNNRKDEKECIVLKV